MPPRRCRARGTGSSPPRYGEQATEYTRDVEAAAAEVRRLGAKRVFLAGASLGGAAVLKAAPSIDPEPAGVVSFAGETNLSPDLDTIAVAPELKAPLLLLTSRHDRYVSVADYRTLEKASGSRDKRVVVYRGTWHGWELLYDAPFKARVNPLVLDFLEEHSGEGE